LQKEKAFSYKKILQVLIPIIAGLALMYYLYRDWDFTELIVQFSNLDHRYLYLSVALAILSHFLRAWRWNLQLNSIGYHPRLSRSFLAVMINYVTNLVFPRAGEIARCASLFQMEKVPIASSFGALVSERIIDFIMLILVIVLAFFLEFSKLKIFTSNLITEYNIQLSLPLLIGLAASLLLLVLALFLLSKPILTFLKNSRLVQKFRPIIDQLISGILTIGKLKNPTAFWCSTVGIWFLYYAMTYIVFFALPEVEVLNWKVGIGVLAVGGIAMALPVQGGIGTYHALVGAFLVFYGLSSKDGAFFAFVLHTTQTLGIVIFGGLAFFISQVINHDKS
jgi:uncharacterized protein (TIRG00374 family)